MAADQQFCLRWNNHQSTLISVFDTLLENGTLVDCTLAAEGQYLKAHKVVLSACSPYMETLLSQNYDKHPILILKDVKFTELKSMMDYMYRGEVNISQDQLGTFLKAAESLQIKGLSENGEGDARDVGSTNTNPPPPRRPPATRPEPEAAQSPAHRSRDGSVSPSSRKRRRLRRNSDDGDNHIESNSCDVPAQSTPVPNIPASITTTPIRTPIVKPEVNDRLDHNTLPAESGLLKEKIEPAEPLLEPKTEYLEDLNNDDSVEDLTLDDDDEMDMSQMSNLSNMSRPGPSHGADLSNQGFPPWQLGNQSGTDEVFMAAQEAVNAHRDSQGFELHMEDSLHFEEHFEEDLSFENKYSDFFYSELEDPNSSDKTSKTANFCLGKETEKCQEVSISNVLPAEHILPHSFEGKIFPNEDQRPKPVTKVSKKNSHHYRRNNIWTHPKRKRRRLRSQMQIKTTSDNEVLVTTKEKVLPEVVLPEQAASSANNLPSPTLSPNSVPVPDQPPVTLTIDHTYSKDVSHMEVSPLAEHSKDKGGRSKKNHVIGSLFRKPGRPVGSTNRRKGSKGSSDARQQPRRRAKSSQESSQNQNDNSVALEDSLQTVECQEVSQLEESTPELTIQTDLSPKKVTESPNNESLEKLNDILKPQNSSEITRSEQIPKPLLLRKDLFPERDKNHSDTDLHQKLIDNNSASTNRKQKCGKSKQHFEFTSVWKRSRKNKNTKTPSAGQRKSSRATKPIKEEPKSSEVIIPDKLESEDDDMNIVITKVVSFNSDPKMASNFIKNEVKQEPGCSSGNDEDVEYMTWTIPQEWTEGLIEANEEEASSSQTGKQKKSKEVSRKMAISPRYKKGSFPCSSCGKIYAYMRGLRQHQRLECNKEPQFPCPYCPTKYRYPQNVRDHIRAAHAKAFSYWYSIHYQNLLRKKGIDY